MISKEQIESVVNAADIVDVIGERIDLRRSGANHKAACPFHDEKTASFMVSHAKQIFKCFGCGVAGDAIKFIMLYENLNYPDAARKQKLSGSLILDVALNNDGSINQITVRRSSGHKVLDDAAIRIVELASPYSPFPDHIREETDILHITRTWQFLNSHRFR